MRRIFIRLIFLSLFLFTSIAGAEDKYRLYTVEPGDSCWSIALKFFGSGEKYTLIHQFNRLGPLPHLLKPGQTIRLPLSAQNPDAKIGWLQRDVKTRAPYAIDWRKAKEDMGLWKLYKVITGRGAAAGIRFEDESNLRMRENALLVIYGGSVDKTHNENIIKTKVKVEEGTVVAGLNKLDGKPLRVQTPSALVELKSKRSQIEVDRQKMSILSVHQGKANIAAQGAKIDVPSGYGTTVQKGKKPNKPKKLPQAPQWKITGNGIIPISKGDNSGFVAKWHSVKGAAKYRVEFAKDKAFRYPLLVALVDAKITQFKTEKLKAGRYFARISAIDKLKLEGKPSTIKEWKIIPLQTSRFLVKNEQLNEYQASGLMRIDLSKEVNYEIAINNGPFLHQGIIRLRKPGLYTLRTRLKGSKESSEIKLRLLPLKGALNWPTNQVEQNKEHRFLIKITDDKDRLANISGVEFFSARFGKLPLKVISSGKYESTYRVPKGNKSRRDILTLRWSGGNLAERAIQIEATKEKPKPAPKPWVNPAPWAVGELEWSSASGLGLPAQDARPRSFLGTSASVGTLKTSTGTQTIMRTALRGGVSLFDHRFGLDLHLPWFYADLEEKQASNFDLGNIRVSARWLFQWKNVYLSPALRLTFPTATQLPEGDWEKTTIDSGIIFQWVGVDDRLTLNTNLFFPLQLNDDQSIFYIAQSLNAAYRIKGGLGWTLGFDWLYSLATPDELERYGGLLASSGPSFEAKHIRLGVTLGMGLTKESRERLGAFQASFTLDLFFDKDRL